MKEKAELPLRAAAMRRPSPWRAAAVLSSLAALVTLCGCGSGAAGVPTAHAASPAAVSAVESVLLTGAQLRAVAVQPVGERDFALEREAVGNIDFDQDMTVQVSPPYQGRIVQLVARAGDTVRKGQLLFTIDSPDLVQAESTLISTAGTLKLTSSALERAKGLNAIKGIAQKDYEQAVSDQQSAVAAYEAARDAVRIFGKTNAEMDRILAERRVDARMPVLSPISGLVTARSAAPGTLVQPGGSPAPYAVADLSTKWLIAQVPEADLPAIRLGQAVDVRLLAYPGRIFHGRVSFIAESVDPDTHRATVRSDVPDPGNELRPQMFANFTVHVGEPIRALAVPVDAVVREGDGTMTVWVTTDQLRFARRAVRIGMEQGGFDEVVDGLHPGEQIAATGALFISNAAIQGGAD